MKNTLKRIILLENNDEPPLESKSSKEISYPEGNCDINGIIRMDGFRNRELFYWGTKVHKFGGVFCINGDKLLYFDKAGV